MSILLALIVGAALAGVLTAVSVKALLVLVPGQKRSGALPQD